MRKFRLTLFFSLTTLLTTATSMADDFPRHPTSTTSTYMYQVRPAMKFDGDSCLPIAAVSPTGQPNGGLKTTGHPAGSCRSSNLTQAYYRSTCRHHSGTNDLYCGIMYAYYFEKDQGLIPGVGHRHDWEHVIMWVKIPNYFPNFSTSQFESKRISVSAHGSYRNYALGQSGIGAIAMKGSRAHVFYAREYVFDTNAMIAVPNWRFAAKGDQYVNYTEWRRLSSTQKNRLNTHSFGSATLRLNDTHFLNTIRQNTPSGWPVSY